jgi:hypothetical protein
MSNHSLALSRVRFIRKIKLILPLKGTFFNLKILPVGVKSNGKKAYEKRTVNFISFCAFTIIKNVTQLREKSEIPRAKCFTL